MNLATAVAYEEKGPLNPSWVDWLMGLPAGYTDSTIANRDLPIHSWSDEPGPRTLRGVPLRRQRLTALGNALVWQVAREVARRTFAP